MIRRITNRFHGTSARITIRDMYAPADCLSTLEYEMHSCGEDAPYARRKLAEIKTKLCGHRDCRCVHTDEGTLEPVSSVRRALAELRRIAKADAARADAARRQA